MPWHVICPLVVGYTIGHKYLTFKEAICDIFLVMYTTTKQLSGRAHQIPVKQTLNIHRAKNDITDKMRPATFCGHIRMQ